MSSRRDNSASNFPPPVEHDAVLEALARAPEDDEPETDVEEREAAEARSNISSGDVVSTAEIRRMLLASEDGS